MLSKRPDTIVSFGDSLSDAGTIFGLTEQVLTVPIPLAAPPVNGPGYAGVWSDGPVYTQIFPGLLGADHYGYAVGSAEAMRDETLESVLDVGAGFIDPTVDPTLVETLLDFDIGFDAQVERFVDGDPRYPNAPALTLNDADTVAATVFIGLNDIGTFSLDANFDNPTVFLFQALAFINKLEQAIKDDVQTLVDSGKIDQLVVIAPPSLKFFPGGEDASDEEQEGADLFQETLADRLSGIVEDINDDGDVEALHLDLDPLMDEIMAEEATFGLTAIGPIYSDTQDPVIGPVNPATGLPDVTYELNADVADLPLSQVRFTDELHFSGARRA